MLNWHNIYVKRFVICLAEKKEKDIKWLLIKEKKEVDLIDTKRKNNHFQRWFVCWEVCFVVLLGFFVFELNLRLYA